MFDSFDASNQRIAGNLNVNLTCIQSEMEYTYGFTYGKACKNTETYTKTMFCKCINCNDKGWPRNY